MSSDEKQNYKIKKTDLYLPFSILSNIIKTTDIPKTTIEESNSELFYPTLQGEGSIIYTNGIKYKGNLRFGILDNNDENHPSIITFPNGTTYTGTIKNNELTGNGTLSFNDGSLYTGYIYRGLMEGKGIYTSDICNYDGYWKNGLKDGKGKMKKGNMECDGEWKEGKINGKCRIRWKSGNLYDGEIKNDFLCGNGYMVWYNKCEKYTGMWDNNLQNGLGIYIWYDIKNEYRYFRDRYVGEWKNGKRDGYGIFYYSNGNIYEGFWKNDKKEGFGTFLFNDRKIYIGNFKNDMMLDNLPTELYNNLIKNNNNNNLTKELSLLTSSSINRQLKKKYTRSISYKETENNNEENKKLHQSNSSNYIHNDTTNLNNITNINNNTTTMTKTRIQLLKEKKEKIIKNIDEIKLPIFLEDIILIEPNVEKCIKDLDNLLMRNLTFISHIYMYACGKEDIRISEFANSTMGAATFGGGEKSKNFFRQKTIKKKNNDSRNNISLVENSMLEEIKKERILDYDNVYNNDLYFCLDLKNFWKLLRESGLMSPSFTFAMINRFIFQNPKNYIEMFFIPELLEKKNKPVKFKKESQKIYGYLYKRIQSAKNIFITKYKSQIDQSSILLYGNVLPININKNNDINIYENFNYHDEKNVILFRYFYEILIRLAYLKFRLNEGLSLVDKVKKLLDLLKNFFKVRRKSTIDLLSMAFFTIIDPKIFHFEVSLESFVNNHYELLYNLFTDLCKYECNYENNFKIYDMTLTYKFFFVKIIKNSKKLSKLFENKMLYLDIITLFYKEKKTSSFNNFENSNSENEAEIYEYIDMVINGEMIFREFCELIFGISRKYFHFYSINTEEEDSKIKVISHKIEIENTERSPNKIRKKTKRTKTGNIITEDIYMMVFNEIIKAKSILEKTREMPGINKYNFPTLKSHLMIEKNIEKEKQKKIEKELKEKERKRYENERNIIKSEDVNVYNEEEDEENENEMEGSDYFN